MLSKDDLNNRYGFHKGTETTIPQHQEVRIEFRSFAEWLEGVLPEGRAKSLAHTALEEASMWANKAVAEQAPLTRGLESLRVPEPSDDESDTSVTYEDYKAQKIVDKTDPMGLATFH